ncbi:MAG TPA: MFS transporter [Ktedonobacteraceae bacterium]
MEANEANGVNEIKEPQQPEVRRVNEVKEPQQPVIRQRVPLVAFLIGNVISYVGDILTLLAIPWFVLQSTGSVTQTGITAFCSELSLVLSSFLSTRLVDRLGYKYTSVLGDILSGVTVALIPLLYHTIGLAFWQLLVLVFLGGLLKSPGVTARSALAPELAQVAGMRLEMVNSLSDGITRVSRFIGAPLAGILIVIIGTSNLLWLDGLSFAFSALLIGLLVPTAPIVSETAEESVGYFAELGAGLRFIRRDSLIFSILLVGIVTNMVDAAWASVVAPTYFLQIFHNPIFLGISMAALGGAAFVGTLLFGLFGHRLPRRLTFGIGYTVGGALRFWVYLLRSFPLIVVWNTIGGLAISPINPLADTMLQERTPPQMRARVFGTLGALMMAAVPLGAFASGFVIAWLGLSFTLALMGALYLVSTLTLLFNPALKKL